ncbi:MAG TPA: DUF4097 family beta strand repeat-containing protein [Rubricoccaceae bacterium]|jgi:hypothetical protein
MLRTLTLTLAVLSGCQPGGDPGQVASEALSGALSGRAEVVETEERTVGLDGRTLVLDGFSGDVRVETSASVTGVRVRFDKRARGATEASARERMGAIRIEEASDDAIYQYVWRAGELTGGLSVDAVAVVPPGTKVVVRTGAGGVAADGALASLDVEAGAGTVVVGRVSSRTLRVDVGAGDVTVNAAAVPAGAQWTVETGAGNLDLSVPPGASLRIDAESGAGRVTDRGLGRARVERSGDPGDGRLQATLGRGEGTVRLRTGAGDVTVGGPTDIDGTESGQTSGSSGPE